jgi:hypothetical protein
MRGPALALALLDLGACSFTPGVGGDGGAGGATDGGMPDGQPGDGGADATTTADADPTPLCDPSDATLRACYTFDGNGQDGSNYNNDVSLGGGMSFGTGRRGQALVTTSGTATVGASSSLNMSMITMDMWIRPSSIPTGGARMGLLDSGGRYRMFLQSDGAVRCAITNGPSLTTSTGEIVASSWQRVTCTYDANNTMRIYVDGSSKAMLNSTQVIPSVTGGMVIGHNNPTGENFDGAIDDLRLFSTIVVP